MDGIYHRKEPVAPPSTSPNQTVSQLPPPRRIALQAGAPTEMYRHPPRVSRSISLGCGGR